MCPFEISLSLGESNIVLVYGCFVYMQCWSYFHLDIGRPEKSEASFPLALLWKGKGSRSKTDLSEYRREIDDLDPSKVKNHSVFTVKNLFIALVVVDLMVVKM